MKVKIVNFTPKGEYTRSEVPIDSWVDRIKKKLDEHGCTNVMVMHENITLDDGQKVRYYRLVYTHSGSSFVTEFPILYIVNKRTGKKRLAMNVIGRIIHDRIVASLVQADMNVVDFEQAMLPYLAVRDEGTGDVKEMQEFVTDNREILIHGPVRMAMLPPGKPGEPSKPGETTIHTGPLPDYLRFELNERRATK